MFATFTIMVKGSYLEELRAQLDGELHWDSLHKKLYATDASVYKKTPLAVAFPKTEADLTLLLQFASKHQTSLIPRTAGTSLAGQCVGEGIVVDISKHMTAIISLDVAQKRVTLQPGVIRDELNAFLEPYGLFFGPNTSTSNRCMLGGMVGNNSSGTTSIQYGVTRDKVLELKVLLPHGDFVLFGPLHKSEFIAKTELRGAEGDLYRFIHERLSNPLTQMAIREHFPKASIHRRNTGYALDALLESSVFTEQSLEPFNFCKLLCGSEGTLAFTTEITLQLDDLPPQHTVMVATQYPSILDCMKDVTVAMKHGLFTCELMDEVILNCTKNNKHYKDYRFFIQGNPKAVLLLELRDTSEVGLEAKIEALLHSLRQSGFSVQQTVLRGEEIDKALELRKAGLGLLGTMVGDQKAVACIEDTAVALEDLADYIAEFSNLMAKYEQEAVYYAHAGAGELHLRPILNLKKEADVIKFRKITTDVAKLVKKYQGSLSGEHGDGIVRAEFLKMQVGEALFQLMRAVKKQFDPQNIFNPGKITDAWPMDQSLRYNTGKEEPHIPNFMDFSDSGGMLRLAEKCNGSGDCRKTEKSHGTLCPSYHATKNEKDTTRGRANVLREVLTDHQNKYKLNDEALKEVFDLCLGCKACATECPSNVDMATAKIELMYQWQTANGASRANRFFGKSSSYYKKASRYPGLVNFLFHNGIASYLIKKYSGVAPQRRLPKIATKSFDKLSQSAVKHNYSNFKSVILFVDEFSNYLESSIAMDALELLTALGYLVEVVILDSARALLSKGFLDEAKIEIDRNIAALKDRVSDSSPLLGIEPSAILGFRDEYLRLATDGLVAQQISKNTWLLEEFLSSEILKGNLSASFFTEEEREIKIHVHCHQKALSNSKVTFDLLNLPKNYHPTLIPSGCCGMAGSFGYEKAHYDVSMKIGELKLFPVVRKTSGETIIVANGTSCRQQILDGTGRLALHPISVLRRALRKDF